MDLKIEKVYQNIIANFNKTKEKYVDTSFPANSKSLNMEKLNGKTIKWLRPSEIRSRDDHNNSEWTVYQELSPSDICQGYLANCWLISSLSVVAQRPFLIQKIILTSEINPVGAYIVKLCKNGYWETVILDDLFPCDENNYLIFSTANGKQLWVPLIEKAMAKLYGSYGALCSGQTHEGLSTLTGFPSETIKLIFTDDAKGKLRKESTWETLTISARAQFLMGASCGRNDDKVTPAEYEDVSLLKNHAYSVLDVRSINSLRLIRLRNPWGKHSWKGDWNLKSTLWTPELIKKLKPTLEDEDDGIFWISYDELIKFYENVDVCQVRNNWWEQTFASVFSLSHDSLMPIYLLDIQKPIELSLALYQASSRSKKENESKDTVTSSLTDLCLVLFTLEKDCSMEVSEKIKFKTMQTDARRPLSPFVIPRIKGEIIYAGRYIAVPLSFQQYRQLEKDVNRNKFALSIHSSRRILVRELQVSSILMADLIIFVTMKKGAKKVYEDHHKITIYAMTKNWSGLSLVVENPTDQYLHIKCDFTNSTNVTSTRSSLQCCDVVPPLHRQLIKMLTQADDRKGYSTAYSITFRVRSTQQLDDWAPAQGNKCIDHFPQLIDDLHTPRPI